MEIDNKNSEEKEVKQPAEIPEKEKDHVLRTAVILATVIIVLGGIVVAVRLNNPKQDTTKGRKILSDLKNPEHPFMKVEDGSIEFRHVDFAYKKDSDEPVLEDIDLKIRSGETIGIIGGTGSAKTSLVNLISRLYDVTKGEVLVGGKNVKDYDIEVLRNQVSVYTGEKIHVRQSGRK